MRQRLSHDEKYGRDDLNERSGPSIQGRIVDEKGVCTFWRKDAETHCGNPAFMHLAVLDQQTERVIEIAACTSHVEIAREATENKGRFTNEHRYQIGLCDRAIDWQCHKGQIA